MVVTAREATLRHASPNPLIPQTAALYFGRAERHTPVHTCEDRLSAAELPADSALEWALASTRTQSIALLLSRVDRVQLSNGRGLLVVSLDGVDKK